MPKRTYRPGERASLILGAFGRYHYLTAEQMIRLLLRPSIRSNAYMHLKQLTDHGYLKLTDWLPPPPGTSGKGQTGIWSIGPKGRKWLQEHELEVLPGARKPLGYELLRHLLAINDCLIELERFCDHSADRWVSSHLEHDLLLKQRQLPAVPDAFTRLFDYTTNDEPAIWWEIDYSGKEEEKRWKGKIRSILETYASGQYEREFGTANILVAVVVFGGENRLQALLRWTEEALLAMGATEWGRNFRFTSVTPPVADPAAFLSGAHWVIPFTSRAFPLFAR